MCKWTTTSEPNDCVKSLIFISERLIGPETRQYTRIKRTIYTYLSYGLSIPLTLTYLSCLFGLAKGFTN